MRVKSGEEVQVKSLSNLLLIIQIEAACRALNLLRRVPDRTILAFVGQDSTTEQ